MNLQDILDDFLSDAYAIADNLGYEINAAADDNDIDIVITANETMPEITIYPEQLSRTLWQFSAEIEFPSVEIDPIDQTAYNMYLSMLESWKDAADLVESITSKTLDVDAYVDVV